MSDLQFRQWSKLLEDRTGMLLQPDRKSFLQTGVAMRMRELALTDYQSYFNLVSDHQRGAFEWITLVDRLTIHETRFFRNPDAFQLVGDYLAGQPGSINRRDPCDIWSVGCSTGEEAYSLAMVADDALRNKTWDGSFSVTGTDISLPVLRRAKNGRYPEAALRELPNGFLRSYLRTSKALGGEYEIVPDLRRRVCFSQANVLDLGRAPMNRLQIIFCQNLLIYFRRDLRHQILEQLVKRLKPGGVLVIGAGDAPHWKPDHCRLLPDRSVQAYLKETSPVRETTRGTH